MIRASMDGRRAGRNGIVIAVFMSLLASSTALGAGGGYQFPKTVAAIDMYNKAIGLMHAHHDADAVKAFRNVIAIEPNAAEAYFYCGVIEASDSQADESIIDLQNALRLDPALAEAQGLLQSGLVYQREEQAQSYLSEAVSAAKKDQAASTIADAKLALSYNPELWNCFYLEGAAYEELDEQSKALQAYAVAAERGNPEVRTEATVAAGDIKRGLIRNVAFVVGLFAVCVAWLVFRSPALTRRATELPDDRSVTPPFGFNLGVFFFTPFWSISNRVYAALLCLVPGIGPVVHLYYEFVGQERAWNGPRHQTARAFSLTNLAWARASVVMWLLFCLVWSGLCVFDREHLYDYIMPYGVFVVGSIVQLALTVWGVAFSVRPIGARADASMNPTIDADRHSTA